MPQPLNSQQHWLNPTTPRADASYPIQWDAQNEGAQWFAVRTRSRQEKSAAAILQSACITHYLPLKAETRQWSDRKQEVSLPLFGGYIFVKLNLLTASKADVLKTPGIVSFVGNCTGPLPIPQEQIESILKVLTNDRPYEVMSHLVTGDRVRIIRGPLSGVEGSFIRRNSTTRLVLSIEMIQMALAVHVSTEDVELLENPSLRSS